MENNDKKSKEVPDQDYGESRNTPYCITRRYGHTFDQTVKKLKSGLEELGFDVVGEFDVQKYLKSQMEEMPKHTILLVCEKETASQLISNDIQMGILLPCNVSVKEVMDNQTVEIAIEDTDKTWAPSMKREVSEMAKNTKATLTKVLDNMEQSHFKL